MVGVVSTLLSTTYATVSLSRCTGGLGGGDRKSTGLYLNVCLVTDTGCLGVFGSWRARAKQHHSMHHNEMHADGTRTPSNQSADMPLK